MHEKDKNPRECEILSLFLNYVQYELYNEKDEKDWNLNKCLHTVKRNKARDSQHNSTKSVFHEIRA